MQLAVELRSTGFIGFINLDRALSKGGFGFGPCLRLGAARDVELDFFAGGTAILAVTYSS